MQKLLTAAAMLFVTTTAAYADKGGFGQEVPEISALDGTAALAAVVAVVLLVWERRRRAA